METATGWAPVPGVSDVFKTISRILKAVEKAEKNQEDLDNLCQTTQRIVHILGKYMSGNEETAPGVLKACEELKGVLQAVLETVEKSLKESHGFRGHVKNLLKANSAKDEIAKYEKKIQRLCEALMLLTSLDTNSKMYRSHAATVPSSVTSQLHLPETQRTENTRNCPPPSRIFHGRQDILNTMEEFFTPGLQKQYVYVLHGLGGAGKTQIALKFIWQSTHFRDKFFIDASTTHTIDTALKNIAIAKDVGESADHAMKWLCTHQEWLIFFDNLDDPKLNLNLFLPECEHGSIIVTSRNPELCIHAGGHSAISSMEEREAIALLLNSAHQDTSPANEGIAKNIVQALGYLPLAIVQAGAFILRSGTLDSYLDLYARNNVKLLKEQPSQTYDNYTRTVYTTWEMSFDKLSRPARTLLCLCSLLHRDGITEDIFSRAASSLKLGSPSRSPDVHEFLSRFLGPNGQWDSLSFLNVTNEIRGYSLIDFDGDKNMFSIHPLVHAWIPATFRFHNDAHRYHYITSSIIQLSSCDMPAHDMHLTSLALLPHVDSLILFDEKSAREFYAEFSRIYWHAGRYEDAKQLQIVLLESSRRKCGDDDPQTLMAMSDLACSYLKLGEPKEAENLRVAVIKKRKQPVFQLVSPDTENARQDLIQAMQNLADTYRRLHQYKQAEELQVVVIKKCKWYLSNTHPDTLEAMQYLAALHANQHKYEQAKKLQLEVLEKRRVLLGDDHTDTLKAMNSLAVTYENQQQYTQAEKLRVVVLDKQKKHLGDHHPDTLLAMSNLASTYQSLGQYKQAEELRVVVLDKQRRLLGDDHTYTLLAMHNLAVIFKIQLQHKLAKPLQVVVVKKWKAILGDDHPYTLEAMENLAFTYKGLGQYIEAEKLEVVVLEEQRKLVGDDHTDTLRAMNRLAVTYHHLGQYNQTAKLLVEALQKHKTIFGDDHPHTLTLMRNLAATYQRVGQYTQAEELRVVVLEKNKTILGDTHPDTLEAMEGLGDTYQSLCQYKQAEGLQVAVMEERRKSLGDNHPDSQRVIKRLALTLHHLDRVVEAEKLESLLQPSQEASEDVGVSQPENSASTISDN